MKNKELYEKLQNRLKNEFNYSTREEVLARCGSQWYSDHKLDIDQWGCEIMNGYVVSLNEVYRSNATAENKSCDITIIKWKNNSGSVIARFRVKCQWKDKRIEQEVQKALEEYRRLEKEEK